MIQYVMKIDDLLEAVIERFGVGVIPKIRPAVVEGPAVQAFRASACFEAATVINECNGFRIE